MHNHVRSPVLCIQWSQVLCHDTIKMFKGKLYCYPFVQEFITNPLHGVQAEHTEVFVIMLYLKKTIKCNNPAKSSKRT